MSAIRGRRKRVLTEATAILQARVAPEARIKAHLAAEALGVSMAAYIEKLIEHDDLDEHGRPAWWTEPDSLQEELPLRTSA